MDSDVLCRWWVNVGEKQYHGWKQCSVKRATKIDFNTGKRRRTHFMSSEEGVGDAKCPIHNGFLQALVHLQSVCSSNYGYRQTQSKPTQCACSLHRILIQVMEKTRARLDASKVFFGYWFSPFKCIAHKKLREKNAFLTWFKWKISPIFEMLRWLTQWYLHHLFSSISYLNAFENNNFPLQSIFHSYRNHSC